jgi:hypothetical protein
VWKGKPQQTKTKRMDVQMKKQAMISVNTITQWLFLGHDKERIEAYEARLKEGDPIAHKEYKEVIEGNIDYRKMFN